MPGAGPTAADYARCAGQVRWRELVNAGKAPAGLTGSVPPWLSLGG
jgi:hypothetical protein